MMQPLPSFDELAELARTHPDQFERLRTEVCEAFINEAPVECRPRLRGLQFRIDMERRRCSNPMASCIRISAMMHESLEQLRLLLNGAPGGHPAAPIRRGAEGAGAQVVSLQVFRKTGERQAAGQQGV